MATIETVTGPIDGERLGRVLGHEHVALGTNGFRENYPGVLPEPEEIEDRCVEMLAALKAAGIDTLVDHTTYDIGRDVRLLANVSRRSGMTIVAATGILITAPRWFQRRKADEITPLFVRDLREGVGGTGVRCGILKCALDKGGLEPALEEILRACARAHLLTGAPISTHTWAEGRTGDVQQRVLAEEGVDLRRVLIGHCGDTEDYDYLHGLLEKGSFIGMDRFGAEDMLSDDRRAAVVARLCQEGFVGQLMLSHDAHSYSDRDTGIPPRPGRANWHYHNIIDNVLPRLRDLGVSQEAIDRMMIGNPRRFLTGSALS